MPLYEYYCPTCESQFDLLRPMHRADEEASCPACQNEAPRVLSTFASFSKDSDGATAPLAGAGAG